MKIAAHKKTARFSHADGMISFKNRRLLPVRVTGTAVAVDTERRERSVRQIICDKRPEQLKMGFALWNRASAPLQPELNPEERLNADLKYATGSTVPARTKDRLKAAATLHMQALEQKPARVKKYFQVPRVKYAA